MHESLLSSADVIAVVDPAVPDFHRQLFGPERPTTGSGRFLSNSLKVVELEIDSTDDAQLQAVIRRVEAAKGLAND